jgi:hypothetical protein
MNYPKPPFPEQQQPIPGVTDAMTPGPDHGETSYKGYGLLAEGADVLISYLNEHDDVRETERCVKEAERKAVLVPGDLQQPDHCRIVIKTAISDLGARHSRQQRRIKRHSNRSRTFRTRNGNLPLRSVSTHVLSHKCRRSSHETGKLHH